MVGVDVVVDVAAPVVVDVVPEVAVVLEIVDVSTFFIDSADGPAGVGRPPSAVQRAPSAARAARAMTPTHTSVLAAERAGALLSCGGAAFIVVNFQSGRSDAGTPPAINCLGYRRG